MGLLTGRGAQLQYNGRYVEELRSDTRRRVHWWPEDRVKMLQWLARNRHSQGTLRRDEKSLSRLAISIGLDPQKLNQKQRNLMKKKLLSALEYALKTLKERGRVTDTWDTRTKMTVINWPDKLIEEIQTGSAPDMMANLDDVMENPTQDEAAPPELIVVLDDEDDFAKLDWEGDSQMSSVSISSPLAETAFPPDQGSAIASNINETLRSSGGERVNMSQTQSYTQTSHGQFGHGHDGFDQGHIDEAVRLSLVDQSTRQHNLGTVFPTQDLPISSHLNRHSPAQSTSASPSFSTRWQFPQAQLQPPQWQGLHASQSGPQPPSNVLTGGPMDIEPIEPPTKDTAEAKRARAEMDAKATALQKYQAFLQKASQDLDAKNLALEKKMSDFEKQQEEEAEKRRWAEYLTSTQQEQSLEKQRLALVSQQQELEEMRRSHEEAVNKARGGEEEFLIHLKALRREWDQKLEEQQRVFEQEEQRRQLRHEQLLAQAQSQPASPTIPQAPKGSSIFQSVEEQSALGRDLLRGSIFDLQDRSKANSSDPDSLEAARRRLFDLRSTPSNPNPGSKGVPSGKSAISSLDQMPEKSARSKEVDVDIHSSPSPREASKSNHFSVPDETDTESLAGVDSPDDDGDDRGITPRATPIPRIALGSRSVRSMSQDSGRESDQHTFATESRRSKTSGTAPKQMQSNAFNAQSHSGTAPRHIGWPEPRHDGEDRHTEWPSFDDNRDSRDVEGWRTLGVEHESLSTSSYTTSPMPNPPVGFPSSPLAGQRQGADEYASGSPMGEGYNVFSPRPPTSMVSSLNLSPHGIDEGNTETGQLLGQSPLAIQEDPRESYRRTVMHQLVDISAMRIWWSVRPGGSQREAMQDLLVERQGIELELSPESSVLHWLISRHLPPSV